MKPLLAAALALSTATGAYGQDRLVRGRIIDTTSAPIVRARVTALVTKRTEPTPFATADSNERGEFALTLPSGSGSLRITKASYAMVTVPIPATDQPLEIRLVPGAVVTGRMLDENGAPVGGLFISAFPIARDGSTDDEPPFYGLSDERGEFRIGGLPAGRYLVRASDPAKTSSPVTLRAGEQAEVAMNRVPATPCRTGADPDPPRAAAMRGAVIRGRVLTAAGIPLACASVRLTMTTPQQPDQTVSIYRPPATTDVQGRFELADVSAGAFFVDTYRQGHAQSRQGPIEVAATGADNTRTRVIADLTIRLSPGGVIAGAVSDERGEPMQGSFVQARQVRIVDGRPVAGRLASPATTDDRGRFRLFGLEDGRWLVFSSDGPQPTTAPLPLYYPGTSDARLAVAIDVVAGQIRDGIDIQGTRIEGVTLSGIAIDATGEPLSEGRIVFDVSSRSGAMKAAALAFPSQVRNGRFELAHVAPGDYVVQVGRNDGRTWQFGREVVTIGDTAPPPLVIRLTEGHAVRGRVRMDNGDAPAALVRLRLAPVDLDDAPSGILSAEPIPVGDDEFRADHVVGTNRFVLANAPPGWYLKSVRIDGRETAEQPFDFGFGSNPIRDVEIVVSSASATVSGTLRGREATRLAYTALVFSTNSEDWYSRSPRVRFARSTSDGRFSVTGIPPGSYFVAAVPALDDVTIWQDVVSLNSLLGSAERLTLGEGETQDVILRSPSGEPDKARPTPGSW